MSRALRQPLLLTVFFLSGMPALMYQVIWQRALGLYFGVDIYSTSVTVATFMLGLGLGSLAGGFVSDRVPRPLAWYLVCELGLGLFGLASLGLFRAAGTALAGSPPAVMAPVDFGLMLVPTVLMGMTLPLFCHAIEVADAGLGRHFSRLYALNTAGAASGALLTAFLLIGTLGLDGATRLAAALNLALAVAVAAMLAGARGRSRRRPPAADATALPAGTMPLAACSLLSGFVALGYELVGYRLLSCLLHGTVYVFGTLLFFFLSALAAGSWAARRGADRPGALRRFATSQLGLALYLALFFGVLGRLSWLPGLRHLIGASSLISFHPAPELAAGQLDLPALYSLLDIALWALLFFGPPAFLMGFGFPNLMRSAARRADHLGRAVGILYLANILGATAGSLAVGFLLLHHLGSEWTLRILVLLAAATGLAALRLHGRHRPRPTRILAAAGVAAAAVLVMPARTQLLTAVHYADSPQVELAVAEDRSGVVALRRQREVISFAEEERILDVQRLLIDGAAHGRFAGAAVERDPHVTLALAAHPRPQRVLSIGLGDGKMAAAAVADPEVEELLVVELNGSLRRLLATTPQGRWLESSPKLRLHQDDGRRWLLAHPGERFDLIMLWPLHAAHAHSGNLFSREFFALLDRHLAAGGLVYLRSADQYSTARTLAVAFPHLVRIDSGGYVASRRRFRFDPRRAGTDRGAIAGRLRADRELILERTLGAPLNRDFRPNSEYYLTYPWAGVLTTWGRRSGTYGVDDPMRFARWVVEEAGPPEARAGG